MSALSSLQPANVWRHFEALCAIPRPSGHEAAVAHYTELFAAQHGLSSARDAAGNVLITKSASPGLENRGRVILQAHLDMVVQSHGSMHHDPLHDPIRPIVEGDWVHADGTTLGGDNGIGVALALAVLGDPSLAHGPLAALFTVEEETGLVGASKVAREFLDGTCLINLDGENDGELLVGCAGAVDLVSVVPVRWERAPEGVVGFRVHAGGLRGGHSGADIHLGHGNSLKLLARFMYETAERCDLRLSLLEGGSARNAIPREAEAAGSMPSGRRAELVTAAGAFERTIRTELGQVDAGFACTVTEEVAPVNVLTFDSQCMLCEAITACPSGVLRMSERYPGVVESSNNLAKVTCRDGRDATVECLLRSLSEHETDFFAADIVASFRRFDGATTPDGRYPGWAPDPDSRIVRLMRDVARDTLGRVADVKVVHAGIECGAIRARRPTLDCVSCGPLSRFVHSPDERLSVSSVGRFYRFLVEVLKRME